MSKIIHFPMFKREQVIEHFSIKEGTPIIYVLTSTLPDDGSMMDIYYRNTPHPIHGNYYFGLISRGEDNFITNADAIEDCSVGMVKDDEGNLQYSSYRHDCKSFKNGSMIDGGRAYTRGNKILPYKVIKGKLVPDEQAN